MIKVYTYKTLNNHVTKAMIMLKEGEQINIKKKMKEYTYKYNYVCKYNYYT
jgi:hypothetical protein